jgi:phosphoenolpyruvate-protein kinase (PTS system EI component)
VLNPDVAEIARFNDSLEKTGQDKVLSDRTADGWRLNIAANIVRSEELPALEQLGVQRIGLFRSEFIFMESVDLPSEKFQTEVYTRVVTAAPKMAVLRTIDIGSDKPLRYVPLAHEENPAMGFRSVRFSLSRPDIIEPQLRAMIRAAQAGNCRIIFPMVSVLSELAEIDALYRRIVAEVKPEKVPEWGIMLEVPSAVFMLADIARYTRYISLGTNDLLQFFFAVDRTNEKLAGIADMMSLPFLRLMSLCVNEAQRHSIKVGICGEMASDPYGFVALLGLGVDEFSMRPAALKNIMALIPQISREQARAVVQSMLLNPPDDGDCRAFLRANFPL